MSGSGSVRRVQLIGKFTYAVTLPKEWVRFHGLVRGSKVFTEIMPDGSLRIRVTPSLSSGYAARRVELFSVEDLEYVVLDVISAFLAGYDLIVVAFNELTRSHAHKLREKLENTLVGLEVEEREDELVFRVSRARSPGDLESSTALALRLLLETMVDNGQHASTGRHASDRESLAGIAMLNARRTILEHMLHQRPTPTLGDRTLTFLDLYALSLLMLHVKSIALAYKSLESTARSLELSGDSLALLKELGGGLAELALANFKMLKDPSLEAYRRVVKSYTSMLKKARSLCELEQRLCQHADSILAHLDAFVADMGAYVSALGIVRAKMSEV